MKVKKFLALFLASAIFMTACNDGTKTDTTTTDSTGTKTDTAATATAYKAVPEDALKAFVDGLNNVKSLGDAKVESYSTKDGSLTEARIRITRKDGSMLTLAVTDLGADTGLYKSYLSGMLIPQGTEGIVFKQNTPDLKAINGIKLDQSTGFGAIDFYNAATEASTRQTTDANLSFTQITDAMQSTDLKGGDFIAPLRTETPDLAGWVIYDAKSKLGLVNAGYADRFAVVVSGSNVNSISELNKVISSIDFSPLKGLKDKFRQDT
jgi:hypothetical protein